MPRRSISIASPNTRIATAVAALSIFVFAGLAKAESHAGEHDGDSIRIKYRQSVMSIIGTNMGAIGDIMKNRLALPGAVANHAGQMAESAALIAPAFRKDISEGQTDAKPGIWQDWAKFESSIAKFETAARNLQTAAEGNDSAAVGQAMRALGKSCGNCHKPFRKPKEESFKNK